MSAPIAVALSRDVPTGTSIGVRVHGVEYVVWRDNAGKAHIWEDRCPHRGMKLSLGFVRGNHIACLYHGWEYDSAGLCQKIPAHPELEPPKTICVPTFSVAERSGMIWFAKEPDVLWPDDRPLTPVRSLMVEARVEKVDAPDGVFVALQPVSPCETMLHIAVDDADAAEAALHWSLSVRCDLEGAVA